MTMKIYFNLSKPVYSTLCSVCEKCYLGFLEMLPNKIFPGSSHAGSLGCFIFPKLWIIPWKFIEWDSLAHCQHMFYVSLTEVNVVNSEILKKEPRFSVFTPCSLIKNPWWVILYHFLQMLVKLFLSSFSSKLSFVSWWKCEYKSFPKHDNFCLHMMRLAAGFHKDCKNNGTKSAANSIAKTRLTSFCSTVQAFNPSIV